MSDETIFTPTLVGDAIYPGGTMLDGRVRMRITMADYRSIGEANETLKQRKRDPQWVTITDLHTDTKWDVRPVACGADCYCSAEARPHESKP